MIKKRILNSRLIIVISIFFVFSLYLVSSTTFPLNSDLPVIGGDNGTWGDKNSDAIMRIANATQEFISTAFTKSNFTVFYDDRSDRFAILNWTTLYDSRVDKFTNINWSTLYDARPDRFKNENATALMTDSNIPNDLTIETTSDITIGGGFDSGGITLTTSGEGSFQDIVIAGNITTASETEVNGSFNPASDNLYDLGNSTRRWKNIVGNVIQADDWTDVVITESQISDLSHTTNTNADTICTGTTTYLDGEGNCDSGYLDADGTDDDVPESGDFAAAADLDSTGKFNGNSLGIGTTSATEALTIMGNMTINTTDGAHGVNIEFNGTWVCYGGC